MRSLPRFYSQLCRKLKLILFLSRNNFQLLEILNRKNISSFSRNSFEIVSGKKIFSYSRNNFELLQKVNGRNFSRNNFEIVNRKNISSYSRSNFEIVNRKNISSYSRNNFQLLEKVIKRSFSCFSKNNFRLLEIVSEINISTPANRRILSRSFSISENDKALEIDPIKYEQVSNDTLDSLLERLEDILELEGDSSYDITFSDGVLTLSLGLHGTYVINKQSPNKQIWLSSPVSGPKRYDFDEGVWVYKYDTLTLHELITKELKEIFMLEFDLLSCDYGRRKLK